jgi:hypothetical protein
MTTTPLAAAAAAAAASAASIDFYQHANGNAEQQTRAGVVAHLCETARAAGGRLTTQVMGEKQDW